MAAAAFAGLVVGGSNGAVSKMTLALEPRGVQAKAGRWAWEAVLVGLLPRTNPQ